MRLRAFAFALGTAALVGSGAWFAGNAAVAFVERQSESELRAALTSAGHDWAEAHADGLILALTGAAPDETSRFHAIEIARQALPLGHLDDRLTVVSADAAVAPAFAVEMLRSGGEVSLIGLIPRSGSDALQSGLAAAGLGNTVIDMLETADHPPPEMWDESLRFAIDALSNLPHAQIRVSPESVTVTAVAADEVALAAVSDRLHGSAPQGVALVLELSAPRPVIAPFSLAFRTGADGGAVLASCSAETEADAALILAAARTAGADEQAECQIGLGAPSPRWAAAAARGITAVMEMGGGSFALTDLEAVLLGPPDIGPDRLAAVGAALDRDLPRIFDLATRGTTPAGAETGGPDAYHAEFRAALGPDGRVTLSGPLPDRTSSIALLGFAEAVFGHDRVDSTTIIDPGLPEGWPGRILSAVEALSLLKEGSVAVTQHSLAVSGRSLIENAEEEIASFFAAKGAHAVVVDVAYDAEAAARAKAAAATPTEACAEAIETILSEEMVLFETGSATIDAGSRDVVAALADVLRTCPGARFEVAGHTDAQGSADLNQRLSERRAAAVATSILQEPDLLVTLEPRGYGAERPVADNGTDAGRALNRRIEFALLTETEQEPEGASAAEADGSGT